MATLSVGDTFVDGRAATRAVQDFALRTRKRVMVGRSGGGHKRFRCSSESCEFFVQLYQHKVGGRRQSWYVSSLQLEHINCTGVAKATTRQLQQLASFRNAVLSDASISASALSENVQEADGIVVTNRSTIYRARDLVTKGVQVEKAGAFQRLLTEFSERNLGSFTRMETDPDGRFRRVIVVSGPLMQSMPYNQQVLSVECAPSKSREYDGQQLLLFGRDGNCDTVLIAAALVNSEDVENYSWVVECLQEAGMSLTGYPIVCSGSATICTVAEAFNINLQNEFGPFANFLESTSGSTVVQELHEKAPYEFLDGVLKTMAKSLVERAQLCVQWVAQKRIVTPGAQRQYDEQLKQMGYYAVQMTTPETGSVWRAGQDPTSGHVVDLTQTKCVCGFRDQLGVPCRHLLAALAKVGQLDSVFTRFAPCYMVENYTIAYGNASVELPVSSELRGSTVLPAKRKTPQRRPPREKRTRDENENRPTRVQRCGNCREIGHNRKRCPSPPHLEHLTVPE